MRLLFIHLSVTTALVFSTAWLTSEQHSATAAPIPGLTPSQIQQLSHDLVPSQSQEFFRQGQSQLEEEIRSLSQRGRMRKEPVLKNNLNQNNRLQDIPQLTGDALQSDHS